MEGSFGAYDHMSDIIFPFSSIIFYFPLGKLDIIQKDIWSYDVQYDGYMIYTQTRDHIKIDENAERNKVIHDQHIND